MSEGIGIESNPSWQVGLAAVLEHRQRISAALKGAARGSSWRVRHLAFKLAHRFAGPIDHERLLNDTEMLTICVDLMEPATQNRLSDSQIEAAVRTVVASIDDRTRSIRILVARLAYPATMLLACGVLVVTAAIFLIPAFDRMFGEFGLRLPWSTRALLEVSRLIQRLWIIGLPLAVIGIVTVISAFWWAPDAISKGLASRRSCWAFWAWHVAMLIELGLGKREAIEVAGRASGRAWLRDQSNDWAARMAERDPSDPSWRPSGPTPPLLVTALAIDTARESTELLKQLAFTVWNLDQAKSYWWLWLLTPASTCLVGTVIGFIVVALFTPLVSLISGLT